MAGTIGSRGLVSLCVQKECPLPPGTDVWIARLRLVQRVVRDHTPGLVLTRRTSAWNWGINCIANQCGPPRVLLPSRNSRPRSHCFQPPLLPPLPTLGLLHRPLRRPGKRVASPAQTFLSNQREPCAVRQAMCWFLMSTGENAMGVCAWSLPPVFATAVRVPCASSANGVEAQRLHRAR